MAKAASLHGLPYVFMTSTLNLCPVSLITPTVVCHGTQSLAVVLRNKNILQYPGDDPNHCGVELLAVGATW